MPFTTTIEPSGFQMSHLVVVRSLSVDEPDTASHIVEYVSGLGAVGDLGITVEQIDCDGPGAFVEALNGLERRASLSGLKPIIHVECHGDAHTGLHFRNGQDLSWPDLSAGLARLNAATGFNLVAVFSACFGAHFLGQMDVSVPAPCLVLVAPTDEVWPDELMAGYRDFYRVLFNSSDAGAAVTSLSGRRLTTGAWFAKHAELWFVEVVRRYLVDQCSRAALETRAQSLAQRAAANGVHKNTAQLIEDLRAVSIRTWTRDAFDSYFMIGDVPRNGRRFQATREQMIREMKERFDAAS